MTSIPNRKRKFDQYCTITWKRWEIGCLLVLLTNRKWHTGFPLVQKVVTSNDWYLSCAILRSHPSNRWPLVKTSFKGKCTKIAIIKGFQQHRKTKYFCQNFCQFISVLCYTRRSALHRCRWAKIAFTICLFPVWWAVVVCFSKRWSLWAQVVVLWITFPYWKLQFYGRNMRTFIAQKLRKKD